ncbi:non-ribosomal peptide synthetase [Streptomyces sp. bgisy130]|uniref:non-ribosomal peptide synthetase n=1 Tax=Streptomyces sp. bgisy130 TaxID=3413788 RepID=UPI003F49EFF9
MTSETGGMLYAAIAAQASDRPEKTALSRGDHRLSYRELATAVDTLATRLHEAGVTAESVVVIDLPVGFDTVVAMAAVSRAGAAFTLLEPELPDSRKQLIIDDCRPAALITESGLTRGPEPGPTLDERLVRRTSPAAYVGYTSGSTGVPKGAVIEQAALENHVRRTIEWYGLTSADTRLLFSSIAFDLALEQICTSMMAGCELAFRDEAFVYGGAEDFLYHCRRLGITVLSLPTGVFNRFGAELAGADGQFAPDLRLVMAGGEAPTQGAVAAWANAAPGGTRVVNGYGPTETAVVVCYRDLLPGDAIAVGAPMDGVRFRLAPIGAEGNASELVIQGVAVGRGYLGRAASSSAFGLLDGEWSYRTGDVATARPDGGYELHGRFDAQVKVNGGFRVEPGEIVSRLLAVDFVLDAVVVPFDGAGSRLLAAFVRLDSGRAPHQDPEAVLVRQLAESLPDYMVPSRVTVLDEFPLTSRGKVDQAALLDQARTRPGVDAEEDADPADVTAQLRLAWRHVLGSPPADGSTSFFAAGGNSVRAIELITQVRSRLDVQLRAAELYRTPGFDALARLLTDRRDGIPTAHHTTGTTLVPMRPAGADRLWVFLPPLSGAVTRYLAVPAAARRRHRVGHGDPARTVRQGHGGARRRSRRGPAGPRRRPVRHHLCLRILVGRGVRLRGRPPAARALRRRGARPAHRPAGPRRPPCAGTGRLRHLRPGRLVHPRSRRAVRHRGRRLRPGRGHRGGQGRGDPGAGRGPAGDRGRLGGVRIQRADPRRPGAEPARRAPGAHPPGRHRRRDRLRPPRTDRRHGRRGHTMDPRTGPRPVAEHPARRRRGPTAGRSLRPARIPQRRTGPGLARRPGTALTRTAGP